MLRDVLARLQSESGAASLAVACARDGEIIFEDGFGWADRARRVPADAHVPYSLASITKPITAAALLRLVEEAVVDLDAPVGPDPGGGGDGGGLTGGAAAATWSAGPAAGRGFARRYGCA